jgi:RNA polymerase sigma-70 factor (ECF subfamily)
MKNYLTTIRKPKSSGQSVERFLINFSLSFRTLLAFCLCLFSISGVAGPVAGYCHDSARMFMNNDLQNNIGPERPDFESLVNCYYQALYRFALSLTHSEADASDLTQQTFYIWATKGSQLKDVSKVKSWLFTTLHRAFLESRRRQTRFPHLELSQVETELPTLSPVSVSELDASQLLRALKQVDECYQAAVALFYLEDYPYKEIAQLLDVPLRTVKSRIARGLAQLHRLLEISVPRSPTAMAMCS